MKNIILLLAVAIVAIGCKDANPEQQATELGTEKTRKMDSEKEWISLFNGENLDNWKAYNSDSITQWKVEDNALVFTPAEGENSGSENLITRNTFSNFELALEYKISEGGNSGLMWAVQEEEKFSEPYLTGPEIQILDNQRHPDAKNGPIRQAGALYDLSAPTGDLTKPAGEWNEMVLKINYEENLGMLILNGKQVNKFPLHGKDWEEMVKRSKFSDWAAFGKARSGHIALQDHGDKVRFRNIRIRELR